MPTFQIDYKKLVVWLTPGWMRKASFSLLLQVFNWPVRQDYDTFQRFVTDKQYRLSHNGQVCYLRAVLNDAFDYTLRRIDIVDFASLPSTYVWPDEDARDINIEGDLYLWPDEMLGDSGIDFTVQIPASIVTSANELAYLDSLLREYKLASKNYNIQRI